jgi:hypothetical protein
MSTTFFHAIRAAVYLRIEWIFRRPEVGDPRVPNPEEKGAIRSLRQILARSEDPDFAAAAASLSSGNTA